MHLSVRPGRFGGKGKEPPGRATAQKVVPVGVVAHVHVWPVIEARTFEIPVLQREAQRTDQMETGIGGRAQARRGAGVRRNLGFDKDDVHKKRSAVSSQLSA